MVMGGVVFSGPSLQSALVGAPCQWGIARASTGYPGEAAAHAHRKPCLHFGRPVQHHRHPSRSSAWFKAAQCAALELRDEEFAEVAGSE